MHVCVYLCVRESACAFKGVSLYVCACMCVSVCISLSLSLSLCMCVCACVQGGVFVFMCAPVICLFWMGM